MFKEEETQYCPMCQEWAEKYDHLKAENKELKTCYKNNLEVLRHEEKVNNNLTDRCMKAEKALQEIKKITEDDCKTCTVKLLGEDKIICKRCYKTKILQKCEVVDVNIQS